MSKTKASRLLRRRPKGMLGLGSRLQGRLRLLESRAGWRAGKNGMRARPAASIAGRALFGRRQLRL